MDEQLLEAVAEVRRANPSMGVKKLCALVKKQSPELSGVGAKQIRDAIAKLEADTAGSTEPIPEDGAGARAGGKRGDSGSAASQAKAAAVASQESRGARRARMEAEKRAAKAAARQKQRPAGVHVDNIAAMEEEARQKALQAKRDAWRSACGETLEQYLARKELEEEEAKAIAKGGAAAAEAAAARRKREEAVEDAVGGREAFVALAMKAKSPEEGAAVYEEARRQVQRGGPECSAALARLRAEGAKTEIEKERAKWEADKAAKAKKAAIPPGSPLHAVVTAARDQAQHMAKEHEKMEGLAGYRRALGAAETEEEVEGRKSQQSDDVRQFGLQLLQSMVQAGGITAEGAADMLRQAGGDQNLADAQRLQDGMAVSELKETAFDRELKGIKGIKNKIKS
jgi:hypothetical protein